MSLKVVNCSIYYGHLILVLFLTCFNTMFIFITLFPFRSSCSVIIDEERTELLPLYRIQFIAFANFTPDTSYEILEAGQFNYLNIIWH